jgi:hypothetical protein
LEAARVGRLAFGVSGAERGKAAFESALYALLPARADAQFSEGLQLLGREDAAHAQLRLSAEAHDRGLSFGDFARALFDERLVGRVGVDGFVERATGLIETARKLPRLRHALLSNLAHLRDLRGRQVELREEGSGRVRGRSLFRRLLCRVLRERVRRAEY